MGQVLIERRGGTAIRYSGIPLPELGRGMRAAANVALEATFGWWRRVIGPKHFMEQAFGWYRGFEDRVYEHRAEKYERRKERRRGHRLPLVWTGDVRDEFLRGTMAVRVNKGGEMKGRAVWPDMPKYTYQERGPHAPRKYAELTVMNPEDVDRVGKAFERFFAKALEDQEQGSAEQARMDFAA